MKWPLAAVRRVARPAGAMLLHVAVTVALARGLLSAPCAAELETAARGLFGL